MAQEPYSALTLRPSAPAPADYFPCNNTTAPGGVTTIRQSIQGLFTNPTIQSPTVTGGAMITGNVEVDGITVVVNPAGGSLSELTTGAADAAAYALIANAGGTGQIVRGVESVAGGIISGTSAHSGFLATIGPTSLFLGTNGIAAVEIDATQVLRPKNGITAGAIRQTNGVTTSVPISTQTTIATADNTGPLVTTVMGSDGTGNEFVDQVAWSSSGFSIPVLVSTANVRFNAGGAYGRGYIASGNTLQLITSPFGTASLTVTVKASSLESV